MKFIIPAETHSDDYAIELKFDALPWFEQASVKEINALRDCGYGGDYPADAVAEFFSGGGTKFLFDYLASKRGGEPCGFECHVNGGAAEKWLKKNRPDAKRCCH